MVSILKIKPLKSWEMHAILNASRAFLRHLSMNTITNLYVAMDSSQWYESPYTEAHHLGCIYWILEFALLNFTEVWR